MEKPWNVENTYELRLHPHKWLSNTFLLFAVVISLRFLERFWHVSQFFGKKNNGFVGSLDRRKPCQLEMGEHFVWPFLRGFCLIPCGRNPAPPCYIGNPLRELLLGIQVLSILSCMPASFVMPLVQNDLSCSRHLLSTLSPFEDAVLVILRYANAKTASWCLPSKPPDIAEFYLSLKWFQVSDLHMTWSMKIAWLVNDWILKVMGLTHKLPFIKLDRKPHPLTDHSS